MGVDLCRSEALVSEQLLHDAQVCTSVEEVCGERVAQRMGVKGLRQTGGTCDVVESCTGTTLSERSTASIQEECRTWSGGERSKHRAAI